MSFPAHHEALTALRYGKRLPVAIYFFRPSSSFVSFVSSWFSFPSSNSQFVLLNSQISLHSSRFSHVVARQNRDSGGKEVKGKKPPVQTPRSAALGSKPGKPSSSEAIPANYATFFAEIKERVRSARLRAHLAVNRDLVSLYWQIGRDIVARQKNEGWGKSVIERLAVDIQKEFPGIEGFSALNLWRMRAFYLA
jgi:DUF1016 N-terminal domain